MGLENNLSEKNAWVQIKNWFHKRVLSKKGLDVLPISLGNTQADHYNYLDGNAALLIFFRFSINRNSLAMVVNLPVFIISERVHVGVDQHHYEGVQQVEQQPGVHHLHVGCLGQAVTHIDKHRC